MINGDFSEDTNAEPASSSGGILGSIKEFADWAAHEAQDLWHGLGAGFEDTDGNNKFDRMAKQLSSGAQPENVNEPVWNKRDVDGYFDKKKRVEDIVESRGYRDKKSDIVEECPLADKRPLADKLVEELSEGYQDSDDERLIIDVIESIDSDSQNPHENHVYAESVSDAVHKVIGLVNEIGRGRKIYRLIFKGHGVSGIQCVGLGLGKTYKQLDQRKERALIHVKKSDGQIVSSLGDHQSILAELKPYFASDAMIVLGGCSTGSGQNGALLLTALSSIWGKPVAAATSLQTPHMDGLEGDLIVCDSGSCRVSNTWVGSSWATASDATYSGLKGLTKLLGAL